MRILAALLGLAACGGAAHPDPATATLPAACREAKAPEDVVAVESCVGWVLDWLLMSKVWTAFPDRDLAVYVGAVGLRVLAATGRPGLEVGFRVLDVDEPQGWSLPGGYVYVTRGALANLHSEAELAALLAHELGHIVAGHAEDLLNTGGADATDPAAVLGALEHERDEERQADELAVGYLAAAGYLPHALASMLVALETAAGTAGDGPWDEHPALPARVARALLVAGQRTGEVGKERYLARTAALRRGR